MMENWLTKRVLLSPHKPALVFDNKTLTFGELQKDVLQTAAKLKTLGIEEMTKVAILGKNNATFYVLILALQQLGATIIFLNNRLTTRELSYQIEDANCQLTLYDSTYSAKTKDFPKEQTYSFGQIETLTPMDFQPVLTFDLNQVTTIMYTSGTTGRPKGVQQTFNNHWWSAIGSALNLGLSDKDSWLCAVPLFHISGFSIMMRSLIYGIPVYLMEHFEAPTINHYLKNGECTIISVVSVMLKRLVADLEEAHYHPDFRCMLLGGGPIDPQTLETCVKKEIPVIQSYGMTETASQVVALNSQVATAKIGSSGLPLFPVELKISKEGAEICVPYEKGEIYLKAPNITIGYLNQPEFPLDSWFKTGDIGYLDDEGYLFVVDRLKDLIISGGENIYPSEIEHCLLEHTAIKEVVVVGEEDQIWDQIPVAYLVFEKDQLVDFTKIQEFCQEKLASYKLPKKYYELSELPRNAAGKIMRHQLIKK